MYPKIARFPLVALILLILLLLQSVGVQAQQIVGVTASASHNDDHAAELLDNNVSTYWNSGSTRTLNDPSVKYVTLDLHGDYLISRIDITHKSGQYHFPDALRVEVLSRNSSSFIQLFDGAANTTVVNLTNNEARFIRLTYYRRPLSLNGNSISIAELDVTGSLVNSGGGGTTGCAAGKTIPITTGNGAAWQNRTNIHDVNADGLVTVSDVDSVLARLNSHGGAAVPLQSPLLPPEGHDAFYDVSGDGQISSHDAELILHRIYSYRNKLNPADVNADGLFDANDIDALTESISQHGAYRVPDCLPSLAGGEIYGDVNGDGYISSADLWELTGD